MQPVTCNLLHNRARPCRRAIPSQCGRLARGFVKLQPVAAAQQRRQRHLAVRVHVVRVLRAVRQGEQPEFRADMCCTATPWQRTVGRIEHSAEAALPAQLVEGDWAEPGRLRRTGREQDTKSPKPTFMFQIALSVVHAQKLSGTGKPCRGAVNGTNASCRWVPHFHVKCLGRSNCCLLQPTWSS